jgi:organic radical activating enzyme
MNTQKIEKSTHDDSGILAVHSVFNTIQGEGPFTGRRAVFIRLAGCNLACPLCDTNYTSERVWLSPRQLLEEVNSLLPEDWEPGQERQLVVITGGEPLRQNVKPTVSILLEFNFDVQIETNGSLYRDLPYDGITVVCSPKTGTINKNLAPYISALKYVGKAGDLAEDDGLPLSALDHPANPRLARPPAGFDGPIYLQPADEQDDEKNLSNLKAITESVLKYGYLLQLQVHKIIGVE